MKPRKVAIIGAGIVGLAHAWSAADRGCEVTVFERHAKASSASIRNFGMVWPIGQPPGKLYDAALVSRKRWLALADDSPMWVNPCGSIHLAHREDEWTVLQEFAERSSSLGISCELMTAERVSAMTPAANTIGLLGGLFSPHELCVNPREAIRFLPVWLTQRRKVRFEFNTTIVDVDAVESGPGVSIRSSAGDRYDFDMVIVCGGADLQTLFPEVLSASGLKLCKLQMMSIRDYETGWRIGPHLASGLTLRHYRNFEICPSLEALKKRIAEETPELDHFGIHVMASQNNYGEIILGDSHEYGNAIEPFDKTLINRLILRELQKILNLPDWTIAETWHGIYAKHPSLPAFEASPLPGVRIFTGTGGAGMTMSFGLAERCWDRWLSDEEQSV